MTESTMSLRYVDVTEAKVLFDIGTVCFIDARTRGEYERSQIPGAIAMSVDEAPRRYFELPRDRLIILYGETAQDGRAAAEARLLLGWGYIHVAVLDGGLAGWRDAGYPVEGTSGERELRRTA